MDRFFELRNKLEAEVRTRSSHKNPMYYHALKDLNWCTVVCALLNNELPEQGAVDALLGVKRPKEAVGGVDITDTLVKLVKPGVNVMSILDKYRDTVPDIHDQLRRVINNQHLMVKGFYIVNKEE